MMKRLLSLCAGAFVALGVQAQTMLVQEDFESGSQPANWSQTHDNPSVGWEFGTASALGSTYFPIPAHTKIAASNDDAHDNNSATANLADRDRLILPTQDLSSYSMVALTFDSYLNGIYGSLGDVEFSTDSGSTWTDIYDITADPSAWHHNSVILSGVTGNSNVMICFRHNDQGQFADGFAIDNVTLFAPDPDQASLTNISLPATTVMGNNATVSGTIMNMGNTVLNSVDVSWSIDGGATMNTQTFSNLNIQPLATYNFTCDSQVAIANPDLYTVQVSISNVNNASSDNPTDNTMTGYVRGLSFTPNKKVLVEEATGTWCGYCPRGYVYVDSLLTLFPGTAIPIAVHDNDPMANSFYDQTISSMIGGYPSGLVDRYYNDVDPSNFLYYTYKRLQQVPSFGIEVHHSYNESSHQLTINYSLTAASNFDSSQYRFNAVLIENGLTGTSSSWDQHNYYGNPAYNLGPMGGWENLGAVVSHTDMVYNRVARKLVSSWNGAANSIPSHMSADTVVNYSITTSVDPSWNTANMEVVGFIVDNNTGEIVNAAKSLDGPLGLQDLTSKGFSFDVYPNPTTTNSSVRITLTQGAPVAVKILDITGKVLSNINYGLLSSGDHLIPLETEKMSSGIYLVNVTVNKSVITKRLMVQH